MSDREEDSPTMEQEGFTMSEGATKEQYWMKEYSITSEELAGRLD